MTKYIITAIVNYSGKGGDLFTESSSVLSDLGDLTSLDIDSFNLDKG